MNLRLCATRGRNLPLAMRLGGSTALIVILVVAFVARLGVVVATPDFAPLFDAADFDRHAHSIADGHGYPAPQLGLDGPTAFRPPAYPVALAAVYKVGGGWTAGRLLGVVLGVLTVWLTYAIARRLWSACVAAVAGGIAAVFPPLVVLSAALLSENLFLPLVLGAVLAVLRFRDDRRLRWAVAAGVLCGLAVLTRTNGLPVVLALATGAWGARPWFSRPALAGPLAILLATGLTLAPWVVRNTVEFDRFVALGTGAGYALAGTYNGESRERGQHAGEPFSPNTLVTFRDVFARRDLDEAEFTAELNDRAIDFIRDHPGYVIQTIGWNVPRVLDIERRGEFRRAFAAQQVQASGIDRIDSPVVFLGGLYVVLLLAVAGAVAQAAGWGSAPRAPLFVWLAPVLLVLPALAIYGLPRYRAPVDPFVVMLAAVGAVAVFDTLAGRSRAAARTASSTASLNRASV